MNGSDVGEVSDPVSTVGPAVERVRVAVAELIVGQREVIDEVIVCLIAGGHALLEGVPGLGKTRLVHAISNALSLRFSRIQFTPDLMPADITGTHSITLDDQQRRRFELLPGPIFGQLVLADEINRATPKTQSALLEAMQEHQVTLRGERHVLEEPFTVLATQNPIEMEGTYPLPEAQLDRFLLKIIVPRPDLATTVKILTHTTAREPPLPGPVMSADALVSARALCRDVLIATPLVEWIARVLHALDPQSPDALPHARRFLRVGPGIRGGQAMVLSSKAWALTQSRGNVSVSDLRRVALPALRHRVLLNFDGESEGLHPDSIVREALDATAP